MFGVLMAGGRVSRVLRVFGERLHRMIDRARNRERERERERERLMI